MKLSDLLNYDRITIQCHDNPDADAVASGYALYTYLKAYGKQVELMYSGYLNIQKPNLLLMIETLDIPIDYWPDNTNRVEGLLVTVDCQYGARNVTKFLADEVIVIDHHQYETDGIERCHIVPSFGSCSTVLWTMMREEGFDLTPYPKVQTALYYGLYMDTSQFVDISNPEDRDMQDALVVDKILIHRLQNSNISARELEIAGVAMIRAIVNSELRFAVVKVEPCDPNILGLISDFVLQVSEIDCCVVFNCADHGLKYSVRSCVKESKANHIAQYIAKDIGSGGGHLYKAGGYISTKKYNEKYEAYEASAFFARKMQHYLLGYDVIDTMKSVMDVDGCEIYRKKELKVGYVRANELLPIGSDTTIRTLEGDLHITVEEDTYIMIGILGEIYPTSGSNFMKNYEMIDEPYDMALQYHPKAKLLGTGEEFGILEHAKSCISKGGNEILAKPLQKGAKIFTAWDRECYMLGEVGDFIACKRDNLHDMYIIRKDIFGQTYEKV